MAISYQPHCGDLAPHTLTQLSTSWCCSNFSICYRMDYTLPVDQQGQHLEHQPRQSQGHQQALNQVHQKAIDTFNGLVCYHIAQLCLHEAPAQLMCLSHPSLLQLPLSSHSAPTLLSCTIKMQLLHLLVTQWLKPSEEVIAQHDLQGEKFKFMLFALFMIKILTLGTGPGDLHTFWEWGWNMLLRINCNLQHFWGLTTCKVRNSSSCHFKMQSYKDFYTGNRAWWRVHTSRMWMGYAMKSWQQLGAARLTGKRFIKLAMLSRF